MYSFDRAKLSIKKPDGTWADLGTTRGVKITLSNGKELYSGEPDVVFDLRLTEADKTMLAEIESAFKDA